MESKKSTNIVWHNTSVTKEERERLLKQKGIVVWLTGFSGSGKSTIANALERRLHELGKLTYLLDGDNIRYGLNSDLGFDIAGRKENIRRIGEVARLFTDAGVIVITSFISPLREDRNNVRNLIRGNFVEVYVDCPLEMCEARDPKGLYRKVRKEGIENFTGISSPYEVPENPEVVIRTHLQSIEECTQIILRHIEKRI